jgi:hypothetical protein
VAKPPTWLGSHGWALRCAAENAIVICVDEKPSIEALERLHLFQGPERPGIDRHDYKRYGRITLFAAFEMATGQDHRWA